MKFHFKTFIFTFFFLWGFLFSLSCSRSKSSDSKQPDTLDKQMRREGFREKIEGKVIRIADGDSFTLLTPDKQQIRVRLLGIDAPERGQKYYRKSRKLLADLIFRRQIRVYYDEMDRYGRILGIAFVDTLRVNDEMVRRGLAWQYRYSEDEILRKLEEEAREKRIGLWKDSATDPWEWRKRQRELEENF